MGYISNGGEESEGKGGMLLGVPGGNGRVSLGVYMTEVHCLHV